MFNSSSPARTGVLDPESPAPGIDSAADSRMASPSKRFPTGTISVCLRRAIAVGAILGASGRTPLRAGERRRDPRTALRGGCRHLRGNDDVWDELAEELELAAAESGRRSRGPKRTTET